MQTRFQSFTESLANTAIGYIIALLAQLIIFHWEHINVAFSANLRITTAFTVVSIARSYVLRRFFNKAHSTRNQQEDHRANDKSD